MGSPPWGLLEEATDTLSIRDKQGENRACWSCTELVLYSHQRIFFSPQSLREIRSLPRLQKLEVSTSLLSQKVKQAQNWNPGCPL